MKPKDESSREPDTQAEPEKTETETEKGRESPDHRNTDETLGPRLMDDDLYLEITKFDPEEELFRPRLQCWDFPGQGDYLQCNLLYFDGSGIYLVFVDVVSKHHNTTV